MDVAVYQLKEVLDVHKFFRAFRSHGGLGWWFRGHADVDWKLIPKAGREEFYLATDKDSGKGRDLGRFNDWRKAAIAYLKDLPSNDWECLAVAQHHGLADNGGSPGARAEGMSFRLTSRTLIGELLLKGRSKILTTAELNRPEQRAADCLDDCIFDLIPVLSVLSNHPNLIIIPLR